MPPTKDVTTIVIHSGLTDQQIILTSGGEIVRTYSPAQGSACDVKIEIVEHLATPDAV